MLECETKIYFNIVFLTIAYHQNMVSYGKILQVDWYTLFTVSNYNEDSSILFLCEMKTILVLFRVLLLAMYTLMYVSLYGSLHS